MDISSKRKPPQRLKKYKSPADQDSRERMIHAGEHLFSHRPFDEVSVDEICDAAGVAHGLLFHYFKSKREFLVAVTHRVADRVDEIHFSVKLQTSSEAAIREFMSGHMRHVASRPASFEALLRGGYGRNNEITKIWEASRSRSINRLFGYLGIEAAPKALFVLGRAWLAYFDELTLQWLQNQELSQDDVLNSCVDTLRSILSSFPSLEKGRPVNILRPL